MSTQIISVNAASHQYPIYIGQNLFSQKDLLCKHIHGQQVLIVTQEKIARQHLQTLQNNLQDYQCDVMYLPDGEQYKNLHEWQKIPDTLLRQQHERGTTLIALGGGVVGDMTGFAAACYLRGVNFIQVPTTLVAQVDAAIGGKTAVNHALGKNMIGAFYQPQCVITDIDFLKTLSERDYRAALAEVIKYGLICDADFFRWLENNMSALLERHSETLLHAIYISAKIKADIVSQDEKDQGLRSLLNLGHTFGHALETADAYQHILHGEAVAIGIAMAAELSFQIDFMSEKDLQRILKLLKKISAASATNFPEPEDFIRLMQQDKKVHAGKLNLILLKKIGEAVKTSAVTVAEIQKMLKRFFSALDYFEK